MGFVLVAIGLLMIVTGALGTYAQFGRQVAGDFTGQGNFLYWFIAIFAVGSVGYVESLKTVSRLFILLVMMAMVLSNRGVFAKATAALKQGPVAPAPISGATSATNTTSNGSILKSIWNAGSAANPFEYHWYNPLSW